MSLSVRKGQPVAAVLGRADGIGIIFVLSSFRMVSIHSVILRFDLNFENPNRAEDCGSLRCRPKSADIGKMHLQKAKACKTSEYNLYGVAVFTTYFIARRALLEELTIRNAGYRMK